MHCCARKPQRPVMHSGASSPTCENEFLYLCSTAIGVKCKDGVILGVEKLIMAKMLVEGSGRRIHNIDEHIGAATAGLMPDARQLVSRAREECRGYRQNYSEPVPPRTLNERMGGYMHLFTVYWYLRPFGASILLAGYDQETKAAELYCCEPTGQALVSAHARWRAPSTPHRLSRTHWL